MCNGHFGNVLISANADQQQYEGERTLLYKKIIFSILNSLVNFAVYLDLRTWFLQMGQLFFPIESNLEKIRLRTGSTGLRRWFLNGSIIM